MQFIWGYVNLCGGLIVYMGYDILLGVWHFVRGVRNIIGCTTLYFGYDILYGGYFILYGGMTIYVGHDNLYGIRCFIGGTANYVGGTTLYLGYNKSYGDEKPTNFMPTVNMFHFSPNLISSQCVLVCFLPRLVCVFFYVCLPSFHMTPLIFVFFLQPSEIFFSRLLVV
jgi:hypothetical protein